MPILKSTEARSNFYGLIAQVNESHVPVTITGKKGNVVMISESDWESINETLFLLGVSGMRESVVEGMNTSIEECSERLDW
jgi:prevent-host-death family protein